MCASVIKLMNSPTGTGGFDDTIKQLTEKSKGLTLRSLTANEIGNELTPTSLN